MVYLTSIRKVCIKCILRLLLKMVENMLFLDTEYVGIGWMLPHFCFNWVGWKKFK